MVLSQHPAQLLLDSVESHHPLLVHQWSVDVDRHLVGHFIGDLYFFLYYSLYWVIDIDGLVHIDRLVEINWPFHLNIDRLLHNLRWMVLDHLIRYPLLNFHNLLNNPLGPCYILGHLDSYLDWLLDNDLPNGLFGHSPILILQLLF